MDGFNFAGLLLEADVQLYLFKPSMLVRLSQAAVLFFTVPNPHISGTRNTFQAKY